jgi:hypothetical protein
MLNLVRYDFIFFEKYFIITIDRTASQRTFSNTDRPDTQDSQMSIETTRSTLQG